MVSVELPKVIVGELVMFAFANKMVFSLSGPKLGAPGILLVIESMSFGWVALENNGERENNRFVGLLFP